MEAIFDVFGSIFGIFAAINWDAIFQLLFVALIMLAGPAVIFVLAIRGGDL
ncbi:photosystem II protein [Leptolyngbya sp. 'hensonii']|uniref:photosystem II reaction center protein Ycf12/Psb30 n=1 Tax=Leptolyngbya sp. 'hensonii' TaxID=1922337 RepID=UPI00094F7941|nr:photosystem II reaction center protein Ycf12 [Leptolyngbya sp. 'hensonii']OLP17217.1 photosystem II protein [Leptolyngbya sp. 'hensonii']